MRHALSVAVLVLSAGCSPAVCKGSACGPADAAVDAGPGCRGGCGGPRPVCNQATGYCGVCSATEGCGGSRPACDVAADNGLGACVACTEQQGCPALTHCWVGPTTRTCVECLRDSHCPFGVCDQQNHWCAGRQDAGVDGGAGDGGADGGTTDAGPVADGGTDGGGWDGGWCLVRPPPAGCTIECGRGFHCVAGRCILNGGTGPVQVTLRWNLGEDVDLHVVEPAPGGPCDVYYGNTTGAQCGAVGSLDLDSNPACNLDNVDIENVIYVDGGVPSGTYTVRVDHYANCSPATVYVPFEVEVRNNGVISGYCGAFTSGGPGWNDHGGSGSGLTVMTFVVP